MQDFLFYIKLGFDHVMDPGAYDHVLFLMALALPFTFRDWKKVLLLATIFTVAHCFSLIVSVYNLIRLDSAWIEFLIPVTIMITALFDFYYIRQNRGKTGMYLHLFVTSFFGLIHGFGFSNYFNMLVAGSAEKSIPLMGFATGIELSQIVIILLILGLSFVFQQVFKRQRRHFIVLGAIIVIVTTIPLLLKTFPQ